MALTVQFTMVQNIILWELENKREWKERVAQRRKRCQRWKILKEKHLIAAIKVRENSKEIQCCEPRRQSEYGKWVF